ncbi:MAG TPA: S9 family peptidase [Bryobacteraceae bacterium]|nr:S9 family peptidase [Bryobacteraceae bacterium]
MRRRTYALAVLMTTTMIAADTVSKPPVARFIPHTSVLNGDTRIDNYFWLRSRENPAVIDHLNAENRYTEATMKPFEGLQKKLYQEILGRVKESDLSVPARIGDYFYYQRTEKGQQYAIYCRKKGNLKAPEEVLLDPNELARGQKYFRIGACEPSPDHQMLAYSADLSGDEVYTIHVKDLRTGRLLADSTGGASDELQWAADNRTFFYTTIDAAKRPDKVFRHRLGAAPGTDVLVYQEPDERFSIDLSRSRSRAFIFLDINSHTTSEYRYLRADDPDGTFHVLFPRRQGIEYDAEHHGDSFYVLLNDAGPNFRLVKTPVAHPSSENATEVIPQRTDVLLEQVETFRNHLVVLERDHGLRQVAIQNLSTGKKHRIRFPEPVYTVILSSNPEYNTNQLRFTYTSLVTPSSVYDYDMDQETRELKKETEVLGGYDPSQYVSERLFATAPDGVEVPISLVYKKGLTRSGNNPTLLYGYGAYGSTVEPAFSSDRLSLLDRGFIYAIAHVRGGSEMGRPWYDAGKMMHKKNSFTDFIACAEYLISHKYTSSAHLAIMGRSAGGLLMGAVANLRPDLFRTVIAEVPFVDVLNTMLDPTLPLTVTEYEEWGDPRQKAAYDYISSYSPYDNVQAKVYPNMLITGGLNDPRVSYWEPAKWAAKLRALKKGNHLLLLKTNMGSGHFGASGRYERFQETAFDYTFLLMTFGME